MEIRIIFIGPPFLDGVNNGDVITVKEGTTIRDLFLRAAQDLEEQFYQFIVSTVEGEYKGPDYTFRDGDELTLFLPVSGG